MGQIDQIKVDVSTAKRKLESIAALLENPSADNTLVAATQIGSVSRDLGFTARETQQVADQLLDTQLAGMARYDDEADHGSPLDNLE